MCRSFVLSWVMGQPWRAAVWDGNATHGYIDMGNGDDYDYADSGEVGMGLAWAW